MGEPKTSEEKITRAAVLMGGPSAEREVSLASGAAVAKALRERGYDVVEVDVTEHDLDLAPDIDAVFIALHGEFGEDGNVQDLLESRNIPYTGSGADSSRLSFDKRLSKRIFMEHGIATPAYELLRAGQPRTLPLPVVVKPPSQGSTIGIHRVFEESEWDDAFEDALKYDEEILVEAYIEGRELTVGIVQEQVLPVVEIRAPDGYYDYKAKYTKGQSEYLVPAPLTEETTSRCQALARRAYRSLHCRSMARVDIRLTPEDEAYVLEVNSIPGFTETSLLPMAARAAGIDFSELCDRILCSASVS